jgi:hypothetical protein
MGQSARRLLLAVLDALLIGGVYTPLWTHALGMAFNQIAAKLNERNVKTARGGRWTHVQVGAILHPFGSSAAVAIA